MANQQLEEIRHWVAVFGEAKWWEALHTPTPWLDEAYRKLNCLLSIVDAETERREAAEAVLNVKQQPCYCCRQSGCLDGCRCQQQAISEHEKVVNDAQ